MGLDIIAYRHVTPAPDAPLDEHGYPKDYKKHVRVDQVSLDATEKAFPGRTKGMQPGLYACDKSFHFRAGSYTGYNDWRDRLARFALRRGARSVWVDAGMEGPFVELINFYDNEGDIGPEVSAKLAKDFAILVNKARDFAADLDDAGYFFDCYRKWSKAFRMAADGGFVHFT